MDEGSILTVHHPGALIAAPPRHLPDACAATRGGVPGCRACADVCPHDALRFTEAGPQIDANACERCGACTAACPLGALERSFLPDEMLFGLVASGADAQPRRLVLTCGHETTVGAEVVGQVRVVLPCIQLVSDDLLVFALMRGAHAVLVVPGPSCPHAPFVQPSRAVDVARTVLEARGWEGSRIAMAGAERISEPRHAALPAALVVPHGLRYQRRAELLSREGARPEFADGTRAVAAAVPWRRAVVDEGACTSCGACAFLCPTDALVLADGGAALYGREVFCIGCELCSRACPEEAITLHPIIPAGVAPQLLARPRVASCQGCGQPFLPEPLVRRIEQALAGAGTANLAALRLCENCKGAHLFECASRPTQAEPAGSIHNSGMSESDRTDTPKQPLTDGGVSRRAFLQAAGNAAAGTMALAACSGLAEADESKRRYGMVIDTRRCVGCNACVIACKAENKTPPGVNYMLVTNNTFGERPDDKPLFTAKPCFHCEQPPCVEVCPVSATFKREQDGIVVVDYDRCIGCRYCQTACPYGARFFDFGENYAAETADGMYRPASPEYTQFRPRTEDASPIGNVRKCTFCLHLQDEHGEYDRSAGRWPACAKTCTGHAIHFGDFADHESEVSRVIRERQTVRLKDELGAKPNVFYLL